MEGGDLLEGSSHGGVGGGGRVEGVQAGRGGEVHSVRSASHVGEGERGREGVREGVQGRGVQGMVGMEGVGYRRGEEDGNAGRGAGGRAVRGGVAVHVVPLPLSFSLPLPFSFPLPLSFALAFPLPFSLFSHFLYFSFAVSLLSLFSFPKFPFHPVSISVCLLVVFVCMFHVGI